MTAVDNEEAAGRLRWARAKAKFPSARSAAKRFGWPPSSYGAHENGSRGMDIEDARRYGRAFKVDPLWILHGGPTEGRALFVPIVGRVSAGDSGIIYSEGQGGLGEAPMPANGNDRTVAVEVVGDSMRGIAADGSLVFYDDRRDPPTDDLEGHLCVIGLADGRVLVKTLAKGRKKRHFDLESASAATIRDAKVEWAAPVMLVMPPLAARRYARKF